MKLLTDWNELRDKAHSIAVSKGFWRDNPSDDHFIFLIVSELAEAVEADRKGKWGDIKAMKDIVDVQEKSEYGITEHWLKNWFTYYFDEKVKDSIGDEMADAVIRILDLAGAHEIDISAIDLSGALSVEPDISASKRMTENMKVITKDLLNDDYGIGFRLCYAKHSICLYAAKILGIDIVSHINLKMMYNKQRAELHGKKY